MAKRSYSVLLAVLLLLAAGCLGGCARRTPADPVILVSPVHLMRSTVDTDMTAVFSLQCRFDSPGDTLILQGLEGDRVDGLYGIRFFETTPDYAAGVRKEGGYYRSYSFEFKSSKAVRIHTLHLLLNGERVDLELPEPVILETGENIVRKELYFSFRPAVIFTMSLGNDYSFILHADKAISVTDVSFSGYLEILACDFADMDTGDRIAFSGNEPCTLDPGHTYQMTVSFGPDEEALPAFSLYRDLYSTLCISYVTSEEPDVTRITTAELTCSGIPNEECWLQFMKVVKP